MSDETRVTDEGMGSWNEILDGAKHGSALGTNLKKRLSAHETQRKRILS